MEEKKMETHKAEQKEIDMTTTWGTWEKEPSTFDYSYDEKETCYILEGEAEVTDKKGNKIKFGKGDWVVFHPGLECTWKISKEIKKRYYFGKL